MFTYRNIKINYIRYGNKKNKTIVLLHGWGQNIEMMKMVGDPFQKEHDILIIDLPGHGKSEEPNEIWELDDFVLMLKELLKYEKIENPILIGHSFGGKLSLLFASKYKCEKLILFGSPYRKKIKKLSLKIKMLKQMKKLPGLDKISEKAKKYIGSTDYRNASPIMRQILVNHVNTDITNCISKIKCPTLLIWGTLDEQVDIEDAYLLEDLLKDGGLVTYEGCSHYAYLERINQTIKIIDNFIN